MNHVSSAGERRKEIPRVVEIIGPAGAGKTTLYKALSAYPDHILLGRKPKVHEAAYAPFFIRYGLQLVPSLLRLYRRNSRRLSSREFAWLSILKGWPFVLQKEGKIKPQVIVLDQGPVYLLAEIRESGPEYLRSEDAEKFWQELYCRWANTLDLIIWLDAEDVYLMERIQARKKEHVVKHESAPIVIDFLARFRRAYDQVVSSLETCSNGPRVLRFDTNLYRPDQIVERLLVEFGIS